METEPHTPETHDAITAELVACTLGQRERLELRVDMVGKLHHAMQSFRRALGVVQ